MCVFLLLALQPAYAQLDPQQHFSHPYGQYFTKHHELVAYAQLLSDNSPYVQYVSYGKTNEYRPLSYLICSSPENMQNLEAIRNHHKSLTGLEADRSGLAEDKVIVWLSFGVHGNEAGASESAIQTMYELAFPTEEVKQWLEDVVVILDPCLNPDGNSRYTAWQINATAKGVNPERDDVEHHEPWPSGRVNHFHFDLNRDWAWATQIETQQRLEIYQQWMPHIHADFHEQYPDNPYYFPPAAEPFNKHITSFQRNIQETIGRNHAKHFDRHAWMYFTGEVFDLFYPSYGDTYPLFNGAIGMTYEQAGHGISGRMILLSNGDTLRLQDRIDHHRTSAMSTIEVAAVEKNQFVSNFPSYFQSAPAQSYTYVLHSSAKRKDLEQLQAFLELHEIEYAFAGQNASVNGYVYQDFKEGSFKIKSGDLVISNKQAKHVLVDVLFEPNPDLQDSLTYDITAWSLPHIYSLDAVRTKQAVQTTQNKPTQARTPLRSTNWYAIPYEGLASHRLYAELIKQGLRLRLTTESIGIDQVEIPLGSVLVYRADNPNQDLLRILSSANASIGCQIIPLSTGFVSEGPDLGSDKIKLIKTPDILLFGGDDVDPYSYGQHWFFLDQVLQYPHTLARTDYFKSLDLSAYNTILLPEGRYASLGEKELKTMDQWVQNGGHLIITGAASKLLFQSEDLGFKVPVKEIKDSPGGPDPNGEHHLMPYADKERDAISKWLPGAIVQLQLDETHPLAYNLGSSMPSIKTSKTALDFDEKKWAVGYIKEDLNYVGFIGHHAKPELLNKCTFMVVDHGKGKITVLMDNPLYRAFWQSGQQLMGNALFFVNTN